MKLRCLLCACCLAALALPQSVTAQNYTFTNIADSTGPFSSFIFGGPRLNNSGTVSFTANLDDGSRGVYRSDGVAITTIADATGPTTGFDYSDINDAGEVSYMATSVLGPGIFRGDGVSVDTIFNVYSFPFGDNPSIDAGITPTINNAGAVSFYAQGQVHGSFNFQGVFRGNGGNVTLISNPNQYRVAQHQINNLGTVAFKYQLFGAAGDGIRLGNGGTTSLVINDTGPYSNFGVWPLGLNDSNVVAVAAERDAGGWDVVKIDGATVDVIAGPFSNGPSLDDPSGVLDVGLNNAGDVAFLARVAAPNTFSILTGPDPVADKVIRDGDPLFGSTVTIFKSATTIDGPNDAGQIVFRYSLANGRTGIALATPIAELAGDYNGNDSVDAADYILWRNNVQPLPNNEVVTIGTTEPGDYTAWRARFGNSGSASGATANSLPSTEGVPEPASLVLLCIATTYLWAEAIKRIHRNESASRLVR